MDKKPKKPIKFKVVKPKKEPEKPKKKKPIKFKVVKKKEEEKPKPKKKMKFKVVKKKPDPEKEIKRVAGVTKAQANKMDPAELFGKLPVELRKKVLNPKETGVKVASSKITPKDLLDLVKKMQIQQKGKTYKKLSEEQNKVLAKYTEFERNMKLEFGKTIEIKREERQKLAKEMGPPFYINEMSFKPNAEMKNFRTFLIQIFGKKNIFNYNYGEGSAYGLQQKLNYVVNMINMQREKNKFRERYLEALSKV